MPNNQVGVTLMVDNAQLKQEFNNDIKLLQDMARSTDQFNKTAVAGARGAIQAQQEYGKSLGASAEQMRALSAVSAQLEAKVAGAGDRMAIATERGARGLSVMAQQGHVTMRSMNQIIAAGGDIAFAFGPEGAILSGVLMVTGGIISHFEKADQQMEETVRKFNTHVTELLMNASEKELGRQAADAFVAELEAQSQMVADAREVASKGWNADRFSAEIRLKGWLGGGGEDKDNIDKAKHDRDAARLSQRDVAYLEEDNPALEEEKKERDRLESEITRLSAQQIELRGSGKQHELAEVNRQLKASKDDLSRTQDETRKLQNDRTKRFFGMESAAADPARKVALETRYSNEESMNPGAEDAATKVSRDAAEREALVQNGSKKDSSTAKAVADQKRLMDEHTADVQKSNELLGQLNDAALQHQLTAHGLDTEADKVRIKSEFDRKTAEINKMADADEAGIRKMSVTEGEKTRMLLDAEKRRFDLLVAATTERTNAVADVEKKANDKLHDEIAKEAESAAKDAVKWNDAQGKAAEKLAQTLDRVGTRMSDDLVKGKEDLGRRLLKAALEPEIAMLQGYAKSQFVQAAKDFAIQDYIGGAEHMLGGTLLLAGAAEIGSLAGAGGGGGGGSSGGGGGGNSRDSTAAGLGSSSHRDTGPLMLQFVVVHQDQNGREMSRTAQQLQRLTDRAVPIRIGALS